MGLDAAASQYDSKTTEELGNGLEAAWADLPSFIKLHSDLHTSEYHFFSSLEVNA